MPEMRFHQRLAGRADFPCRVEGWAYPFLVFPSACPCCLTAESRAFWQLVLVGALVRRLLDARVGLWALGGVMTLPSGFVLGGVMTPPLVCA